MVSASESIDTTLLDAAMELSEQGFHVIPLGTPGEYPPNHIIERAGNNLAEAKKRWPKTPRITWAKYQKVAPTDEEIQGWWTKNPKANIGIVTGIKVVVVDADSEESAQWVKEHLTRTPWVVKTSRGFHFYYQASEKIIIRNSANEHKKIDIRGIGGQVCAPPSVHSTGSHYEWIVDESWAVTSTMDLPTLSNDDLGKIHGVNASGDDFGDLSAIKDLATGDAVSKGERNNAAASLAGQYIQSGDSIIEIEKKLQQWNRDNLDPLPGREIQTITASVAATHTRKHPDELVPFIPTPPKNTGLDLMAWTAKAYDKEPEPRRWLVEDLIPEGKPIMIASMGDVGKSMLMVDLAFSVATGREHCAMGGRILNHGTAVIITAEDDYQEILRRISAIDENGHRMNIPERLIIVPLPDAGGPFQIVTEKSGKPDITKEYRHIEKQLLAIDDLAMVVFDPLQTFVAADITSSATAGQFVCSLASELAATTGAAVIFTHHMRKGNNKPIETVEEARDAIRGTTALVDGVRCVYALWPVSEEPSTRICQELITEYERNKVIWGAIVKSNAPADRRKKTYLRNDYGLLIDGDEEGTHDKPDFDENTGNYNALTQDLNSLTKDQKERINSARSIVRSSGKIGKAHLTNSLLNIYNVSSKTIERDIMMLESLPAINRITENYNVFYHYQPPETDLTETEDTDET